MCKKMTFRWAAPLRNSEEYSGFYQKDDLAMGYVYTKASLTSIVEIAKQIENLKYVELTLGPGYRNILIDGLTTPIQFIAPVDDFTIEGNGPSLQSLVKCITKIDNFNPSKVFCVEDMIIQFLEQKTSDTISLSLLDIKTVKTFTEEIAGTYIGYLDGTFKEFLENYGYTDKKTLEAVPYIFIAYRTAKKLGFTDPKEVINYFGNKRLIADLTLKGVFEAIEEY